MKPLSGKFAYPALWIALAAFALPLFSHGLFHDGDSYWHIAAGRWMLDNFAVLRIDPFSFTMAGQSWHTHEWLSEVLMALSYVGLGWNGIALLFAAVFALTAGLMTHHLSRYIQGLALPVMAILALACICGGLLARPHILALPCLEIWIAAMVRARAEAHAPHWSLIPVMVIWANLHDSFLVGLALTAVFALEALAEAPDKKQVALIWGRFFMLALIAAMLTPFGIYSLIFPFTLMGMPALYGIQEWMPQKITLTSPFLLSAALALYMLLSRGAKIRPLRLVILIGLVYLSLAHGRHQIIAAIIAPFLLAEPLAAVLQGGDKATATLARKYKMRLWAGFAACLMVLCGVRFAFPITRHDDKVTPQTALAHVPEALRRQPVFNSYAFGGYLIFQGVAPFIDGRAELYGEKFLSLYDHMTRPGSKVLEKTLDRYHISWALVAPKQAVANTFRTLPGWHETYHDSYAVLFIKGEPRS